MENIDFQSRAYFTASYFVYGNIFSLYRNIFIFFPQKNLYFLAYSVNFILLNYIIISKWCMYLNINAFWKAFCYVSHCYYTIIYPKGKIRKCQLEALNTIEFNKTLFIITEIGKTLLDNLCSISTFSMSRSYNTENFPLWNFYSVYSMSPWEANNYCAVIF